MSFILGIDPGSQNLGLALINIETEKYFFSSVLIAKEKNSRKRIIKLWLDFEKFLHEFRNQIKLISMEKAFQSKFPSALMVLGEIRGFLLSSIYKGGFSLVEPTPKEIKKAVYKGTATKNQVEYMVRQIFSLENKKFISQDESDAIAIAFYGLKQFKNKIRR